MRLADFDYELPPELIANEATSDRSGSRMLVVQRTSASLTDEAFTEFAVILRDDDVLVLNNTRVFPARLFGRTETGANVEVFLVTKVANNLWRALARPAKRLKLGRTVGFSDMLSATVLERSDNGGVVLLFTAADDFDGIIDKIGKTPLPPYIKRDRSQLDRDRERYQTVYAKQRGAIAAPTAGLHFTPEILDTIKQKGVSVAEITLHVGYGTFEPVRVDDLSEHNVQPEQYEMQQETANQLNEAKKAGRRIIAVGTTTTRALETNFSRHGRFKAENSFADLTIRPGDEFNAIDGLLTNFHLPKSSLLVLVSTFGGHELIMNAYRHAVESRYRFYSYGDCMLIL
ncbi:MAG TPA: tRNA preQ1(34) S-adenosylmethionine ribosyltransferase-isomerase QueA [Pyrinomonadaceae bacterium]|nr:tRNA preQ1(34) S-adenosylmethionine ribosyltransferase-isomerase QueA [Pyrinomonadaceae bacterium]